MSVGSAPRPESGDVAPRHGAADPEGEESRPGGRLPHCEGRESQPAHRGGSESSTGCLHDPRDADDNGPAAGAAARWLRAGQDLFFTVVLLSMVVLGLLPILARFGVPISASWAEPLVRQMVLWLALFGAAAATAGKKHISVDTVTHFLPRSPATCVKALTALVASGVSGVLAWVSIAFVRGEAEYAVAGGGILGAPDWCWQLALPVGFSFLALSLLLGAWREIRSLVPSKAKGRPS